MKTTPCTLAALALSLCGCASPAVQTMASTAQCTEGSLVGPGTRTPADATTTVSHRRYTKIVTQNDRKQTVTIIGGDLGPDDIRPPNMHFKNTVALDLVWKPECKCYQLNAGFVYVRVDDTDPVDKDAAETAARNPLIHPWIIITTDSISTGAEGTVYELVTYPGDTSDKLLRRGKVFGDVRTACYARIGDAAPVDTCPPGSVRSLKDNGDAAKLLRESEDARFQGNVQDFVNQVP